MDSLASRRVRRPMVRSDSRPLVIGIGPVPPPVHGAAAVTSAVWSELRRSADLVEVDTSAGETRGVSYHLLRIRRHGIALLELSRHRRHPQRAVYATCPAGMALWYLVVVAGAARALGYRVVVHHHSYAYLGGRTTPMKLLVAVTSDSAIHVLLCGDMRDRFAHVYRPPGRLVVCSNAAWVPAGGSRRARSGRRIRLGYLGRLTVTKGIGEVLGTLGGLLEAGVDAELHVAGPPPEEPERRLLEAGQKTFGPRLRVDGVLSGKEKERFFSEIDAFLLPTRYVHEAEPLVILEALASGARVVAYARGCIGKMIGMAGLVIDTNNDFVQLAVPYLSTLADPAASHSEGPAQARVIFEQHRSRAKAAGRNLLSAILQSPSESDEGIPGAPARSTGR